MTTGCKVWLWIIFVVNLIALVGSFMSIILNPITGLISVVAGLGVVLGSAMLLFSQKKIGFYLIVGGAAIMLVFNIISGVNIVTALISAVLMPSITYLFISKNNGVFH